MTSNTPRSLQVFFFRALFVSSFLRAFPFRPPLRARSSSGIVVPALVAVSPYDLDSFFRAVFFLQRCSSEFLLPLMRFPSPPAYFFFPRHPPSFLRLFFRAHDLVGNSVCRSISGHMDHSRCCFAVLSSGSCLSSVYVSASRAFLINRARKLLCAEGPLASPLSVPFSFFLFSSLLLF